MCWKEKLEGCDDGVVQAGPCAFCQCENNRDRETERIQLQAKTKIPQIRWRRCHGWAMKGSKTRYPVMSVADDKAIVVLSSGRLAVKKMSGFQIEIDFYYDARI